MDPERSRQIEEVYRSALAQEPGERPQFLAKACADDPELLHEVELLLARDPSRTVRLDETGTVELTRSGPTRPAQLGPYKIEETIGAGGMGEVFRAYDTRLHRTVAIKVLPHASVADPERRRRFLQEARAASALNHPNIVTLHDIASDRGIDYLVMEYVAGRSLDALIVPKGLPLAEAVGYAAQIAGALAVAHAAGIVHRDIKSANVMVTPASQVKILDFGLAKLAQRTFNGQGEGAAQEPAVTETGVVMGTVGYMSPEQASGRPADHRSDIFSLGVVLYEMIAGSRPFRGKSHVETMNAIINEPPRALPDKPPELREILDRALAKDPQERYQHAGDLSLDLRRFQRAFEARSLGSQRARDSVPPKLRRRWLVAAAVLAPGIPAAWWIGRKVAPATNENPLAGASFTRFTDFVADENDAEISPDGTFVAFRADRDGRSDVWLSRVGSGQFINLTKGQAEEPLLSFTRNIGFSFDGSEIWLAGYSPAQRLRLMPLMGGTPRAFLRDRTVSVAWSPNGSRVAYHTFDAGDPIFVADRTGSNARQIFKREAGAHNHFPVWSSDGRWIYFTSGSWERGMDIWRIAAEGGQPQQLTHHKDDVRFVTPLASDIALYVSPDGDGSGPWLWALDIERKTTRRITFGLERYLSIAASADGRRLVATVANPTATLWRIPILDRLAGESDVEPFPVAHTRALGVRFAGRSVFYLSSRGTGDGLWRFQDGQASEIWKGTDGPLLEPVAVSPDGRRVAIVLRKEGKARVHLVSADGAELQLLTDAINVQGSVCWSPDGKWIATGGDDAKGVGLFKIAVEGGAFTRIPAAPGFNPVWSPDGTLLVYQGESVARQGPLLAIRPDGSAVGLPVTNISGGTLARHRFLPDGKGIVYMPALDAWQEFWLLDLASKKTKVLARLGRGTSRSFDITPDGKQIVFDRLRDNSNVVLIDLAR